MELQKRMCSLKDDSGLDRLSEMPDQVIVHILSFIPTHEAVRTMLLRRFGKLWTSVSALRFDFSEYYVRRDSSSDDDDEDDDDDKEQASIDAAFVHFTRFVRNVLTLHKRPTIDSFHLNLIFSQGINVDQYISKDARVWLQFATDREVKHLFFGSKRWDSLSPHCCVFTSQSLVTLVLHGCMLEEHSLQSKPHHMGSLRKLLLVDVKGTDEAFDQLISACLSLQELDIYLPFGLWTITSPTVRRLNLEMRVYLLEHPE